MKAEAKKVSKNICININVDTSELEDAIQKANQLIEILNKINTANSPL